MKNPACDKLILAILQGENYYDTVSELNGNGFYVTLIRSSGGFLKKQSVMILIGLHHADLEEAMGILKRHGKRTAADSGAVVFVLDIERYARM